MKARTQGAISLGLSGNIQVDINSTFLHADQRYSGDAQGMDGTSNAQISY